MKAMIYEQYGPPEGLKLTEIDTPAPNDDQVLVKIHAASVNFGDTFLVRGKPFMIRLMGYGLLKPKYKTPGTDIAGQVEAVGKNVTKFQVGDEVFADIGEFGLGAFAEYAALPEEALTLKPVNMTFEQSAAVPQAAVVALQGLRDDGKIQAGRKVLINGASGGIGTFAVQIAKSYGAEVTGVCSTRNLDLVRSIGADQVIDYTQEDFTQNKGYYDLILDIVANRPTADYLRALSPQGCYVAVAFNPKALFLGSMMSKKDGQHISSLVHKPNIADLDFMKALLENGAVTPVIDRSFPLDELPQAIRYLESGEHVGKVVITVVG